MRGRLLLLLAAGCATSPPPAAPPPTYARKQHEPLRVPTATVAVVPSECAPVREEFRVPSSPGVEIFVMRKAAPQRKGAVLLTHGAGSPGSSIWDLPGEYSMLTRLACAGFDAYALDVRGFGGSTPVASLSRPARLGKPAVRAREVMADVDAVVQHAMKASNVDRVHLVGWSWGSLVAGMYATQQPDRVGRLLLYAPVYDRKWPKRHQTEKAWYPVKRGIFFEYHDPKREDRAVLDAFVAALFRFTDGDELRLPNGPYADLYGPDAPVWSPAEVKAPTLVVRGDKDRASLDAHAQKLFSDLTAAPVRRYVVLGGAGHFAFRTYMYRQLQSVVLEFLQEE